MAYGSEIQTTNVDTVAFVGVGIVSGLWELREGREKLRVGKSARTPKKSW